MGNTFLAGETSVVHAHGDAFPSLDFPVRDRDGFRGGRTVNAVPVPADAVKPSVGWEFGLSDERGFARAGFVKRHGVDGNRAVVVVTDDAPRGVHVTRRSSAGGDGTHCHFRVPITSATHRKPEGTRDRRRRRAVSRSFVRIKHTPRRDRFLCRIRHACAAPQRRARDRRREDTHGRVSEITRSSASQNERSGVAVCAYDVPTRCDADGKMRGEVPPEQKPTRASDNARGISIARLCVSGTWRVGGHRVANSSAGRGRCGKLPWLRATACAVSEPRVEEDKSSETRRTRGFWVLSGDFRFDRDICDVKGGFSFIAIRSQRPSPTIAT